MQVLWIPWIKNSKGNEIHSNGIFTPLRGKKPYDSPWLLLLFVVSQMSYLAYDQFVLFCKHYQWEREKEEEEEEEENVDG